MSSTTCCVALRRVWRSVVLSAIGSLLSAALCVASNARTPRPPLPLTVLLGSAASAAPCDGSGVGVTPPYTCEGPVEWSVQTALSNAFGVRHGVEFFPGDKFELVFDARLDTSADVDSFVGFVLNEPGSMAVFTHYKQLFKLTVDSPERGHYSVHRDASGRYTARKYTGKDARHGSDDAGDAASELAHLGQALDQIETLRATAQTELDEVKKSWCVTIHIGGGGRDAETPDGSREGTPSAGTSPNGGNWLPDWLKGFGGVGIPVGKNCTKSRDDKIAELGARIDDLKAEKERTVAAQRRLGGAAGSEQSASGLSVQYVLPALEKPGVNLRLATPPSSIADIGDSDRTPSTTASNVTRPSPVVDSFKLGADCVDPAGRIDVAVVVSERVKAHYTDVQLTDADLWLEIVHGLNMTNAALRGSNISAPGIDYGFRIVNRDQKPVVFGFADDKNLRSSAVDTAVKDVFDKNWPPDAKREARDLYRQVDLSARNADVVLALVEGDSSTKADRGRATVTTNAVGDQYDRRLAVVKRAAFKEEFFYTVAHELGHTLGAGHDSKDGYKNQSYAQGAVRVAPGKRWASLMALSECPESDIKADSVRLNCRRVPYYSSATLAYPDYGDELLGSVDRDNASAMRLTRDNVARLQCAKRMIASTVWLQKGPSEPEASAAQSEELTASKSPPPRTEAWESKSIWLRPTEYGTSSERGRDAYQHSPPLMGSEFFPTVILNNASNLIVKGQLEVWRVRAAKDGLLLTPRWGDLELLGQCSNSKSGLISLPAMKAAIVQVRCENKAISNPADQDAVKLAHASDAWVVRWNDVAQPDKPDNSSTLLSDAVVAQSTTTWRSIRDVDLGSKKALIQQIFIRNLSTTQERPVNVRIEPGANQFNFNVRDTGLDEIIVLDQRYCREKGADNCLAVTNASDSANERQTIELLLPKNASLQVTLKFKQTAKVPQQSVLLRVSEHDYDVQSGKERERPVGGTSYVVRHSPKAADEKAID